MKIKKNLFKDNINNTPYIPNMSKPTKKTVSQESNQPEKVVKPVVAKEKADKPEKVDKPVKEQPVANKPVVQNEVLAEGQAGQTGQTGQTGGQDEKVNFRQSQFEELLKKVEQSQEELSALKTNLKKFYKLVEKDVSKAGKGRRRVNRERSPTGFGKSNAIPAELCKVLKLDENTELTRPQLTGLLYKYLDTNGLRDQEDKRIMRVNGELTKAFGLTAEQAKSINKSTDVKDKNGMNFYNIQKFVAALYAGKPINFDAQTEDDANDTVAEESETEVDDVEEMVVVPAKVKVQGKKTK